MAGLKLTYDALQDRLLLDSQMNVKTPIWWLSRRTTLKLYDDICRASSVQYAVTQQLNTMLADTKPLADGSANNEVSGFEAYHQQQLENSDMKKEVTKSVDGSPELYPLVNFFIFDLLENNHIAIILSDSEVHGVRLEFHESGVHRLQEMLRSVMEHSGWL